MPYKPPYHFQWQNPELRKSIYPFREQKLRDFLLAYEEVDLWEALAGQPVDSRDAVELVQELNRIGLELKEAKLANERVKQKQREVLRNKTIRDLVQNQVRLRGQFTALAARKNSLQRRVEWYEQFAREHPYYQKFKDELDTLDEAYSEKLAQLQVVTLTYVAEIASALLSAAASAITLHAAGEIPSARILRLTEAMNELPRLDKNGEVTQAAAVRWRMLKRKRELETRDHDRLLAKVIERFESEPVRYPKWLQYMVIHFSGMRYRSAHGSWASPHDLLEMLEIEDLENWARTAPPAELEKAASELIPKLQAERVLAARPVDALRIDNRIATLKNSTMRGAELVKYRTPEVVESVRRMSEAQVLEQIKARKEQFPPWAWKEIVSRTGLRVTEVADKDWEELDANERAARLLAENEHWRELMNAWERKDITAWRKQHEATLSLIVTRAVCNEVAEHIQHLRGVKPAAGLTAKPQWYLRLERTNTAKPAALPPEEKPPYFRPPGTQTPDHFRPGASILWLGWVTQRPNAWQIATPLPGIELVPAARRPKEVRRGSANRAQAATWNYRQEGSDFVRISSSAPATGRPPGRKPEKKEGMSGGKGGPGPVQINKEWLRWTHEAIVVDVVRMAGNVPVVLTFEPVGKIGVNRRTLNSLLNSWEIYVGYIPSFYQTDAERVAQILQKLEQMLERKSILAPEFLAPPSFEAAPAGAEPADEPALGPWESLTRREQQVVVLVCRELPVREIAARLEVSQSTVKRDLANAQRKFGVTNRAELRRALLRKGAD